MSTHLVEHAGRDLVIERGVLALCLLTPATHRHALEAGVTSEHFYREGHRHIWVAMSEIADRGGHPSVPTVCEILQRDGAFASGALNADGVDEITTEVASVGAFADHVQALKRAAAWRLNLARARQLLAAAEHRVPGEWRAAEDELGRHPDSTTRRVVHTPDHRSDAVIAAMKPGQHVERFAWPLHRLNQLSRGGARRGHLTVMAGPVSHGKSSMLDEALEVMWQPGRKVALYLNEMEPDERSLRIAARLSGVSLTKLQQAEAGDRELTTTESASLLQGLQRDHIDIIRASGWTAARVCQHARRQAYDVIGFDILQRLRSDGGRKRHEVLDDAVNEFDRLAKDGPGRHVIIAAHVNRARAVETGRFPMPGLTDLKDTGSLAEVADNVLFVWRKQDRKTLEAMDVGVVRFAKCRGGKLGGEVVVFDGEHQRFQPGTAEDERELNAA